MVLKVQKFTSAERIQRSKIGRWQSFIPKDWKNFSEQKTKFQQEKEVERRMKMKACENHHEAIVVFNEDVCPLCKAEKTLKNIWEEVEKSMMIMKQIKQTAEEAGMKFD
jgi:hypothetical protein